MRAAPTSTPGVQVVVRDLEVAVGRAQLLTGVSLCVRPGELVGLLGPSGCGKSTLLKVISGQMAPTSGEVKLHPQATPDPCGQTLLGWVPQDDIVHEALSVESALTYSARLRLPPDTPREVLRRRVDEVIALMELEERRTTRIARLSGGQRKRVSVGVELLTEPPLLLLDEPTAGLDPLLEEHMIDLFGRLARTGRTLLVSTHILQSIDRFDRVCVLARGHVVFVGPALEALTYFGVEQYSHLYRALASDPSQLAQRWRASALYERYVGSQLTAGQSIQP
jgi:ABC transport system ATP-binding/permease protein